MRLDLINIKRFVYSQGVEMMEFSARRFQDLELTDHENTLMVAVCAMYPGELKHIPGY